MDRPELSRAQLHAGLKFGHDEVVQHTALSIARTSHGEDVMTEPIQQQGNVIKQLDRRVANSAGIAEPQRGAMQRLTSSVLTHLFALPLFAGVHRLVSLAFQAANGCLEVTDQMKVIAATRDITESELLASPEAAAAISDYGLRCKTAVDQFQQPDAPGLGVAMFFPTEQVAEGGCRVDPHQNGSGLEDLIVCTDTHGREIVLLVDPLGRGTALRTMLWTVPRDIE